MNTKIFSFLIYFLLAISIVSNGQDRTQVELINADNMRFDRTIAPDARRLIGNVQFRHEQALMYCDSAYHFSTNNNFNAFGNIVINVNDTITIFGDRLYYDGNTRIAELHGNVKLIDDQMTLTTEHLFYNLQTNTANFFNGGKIENAENTLTSIWGFYYANDRNFFFKDDVELINPEYVMNSDTLKYNTLSEIAYFFGPTTIVSEENTIFAKNGWYDTRNDIARFSRDAWFSNGEQFLSGDSLFYDRNLGYGKALNNVLLKDSAQQTHITGHFAEHFEHKFLSEVTQQAVLTVISQGDSLFLHADTLRSIYDEENNKRLLFAFNRARFFKSDLQGLSDSIVYNFSDSTIYLYNSPIVWSENHQMTAERIEVKTSHNRIETVILYNAAFIVSQEDTLGFNQIRGRRIVAHFGEDELSKIDVFGNGEALYWVREENGNAIGVNKSVSTDLTIHLEENEVSSITLHASPVATLFPPQEIPQEERYLQHFEWVTERRPLKKEDIFIWHE